MLYWLLGQRSLWESREERDTAPNCVNTATLEHAHQMAATTTPRSVIAVSHKPSQVPADVKDPSQATAYVKSQVESRWC